MLMGMDAMELIGVNISVIYQNKLKLISTLSISQDLESLRERDLPQELKNLQRKSNP